MAVTDRKGDPTKQPPECESRFTPHAEPRPHGAVGKGEWSRCPNLRETSSPTDMDGETYDCDICGKYYRLYYDEMA